MRSDERNVAAVVRRLLTMGIIEMERELGAEVMVSKVKESPFDVEPPTATISLFLEDDEEGDKMAFRLTVTKG